MWWAGFSRCVRFIPACAGNADHPALTQFCLAVHPRVCGERAISVDRSARFSGSSPRVRGTHCRLDHRNQRGRFIPACAGNAESGGADHQATEVHPRVCGERLCAVVLPFVQIGSSPRVRGTRIRSCRRSFHPRFIPACAGNADHPAVTQFGPAVHPRVCGERTSTSTSAQSFSGSSPRVRGTRERRNQHRGQLRFIPACAGNAHTLPISLSV